MAEAATSYKDPSVLALASNIEQKLNLPPGLLAGVVARGERSNSDQVSDAGARGLGQIIPATRKAAIDAYGIDPYLSDENSLEVAGHLLKDSLDRNKGDVSAAVSEYHGGTDRSNWGPVTKAYVQRVMSGLPAAAPAADGATNASESSTFDKLWGATNAPKPDQISNILKAYQNGQMAPEDARQFKTDVDAGHIMLPVGATLQRAAPPPTAMGQGGTAVALPQSVVDAFNSGKITGKDREQLLSDVASGHVAAPAGSRLELAANFPGRDYSPQIPGMSTQSDEQGRPYVNTAAAPAGPGLVDQAAGAGEAGLAALSSIPSYLAYLTGGAAQAGKEALYGLSAGGTPDYQANLPGTFDRIADAANQTAGHFQYAPRTATGQDYARALAEAAQPLAGMNPLEGSLLASGARPAAGAVAAGVRAAPQTVADGATAAADAIRAQIGRVTGETPAAGATTPGTLGSAGAAGTDIALQRQATAAALPVPIRLTQGQATRDFAHQQFEGETAKRPDDVGEALRENNALQNKRLGQNFDAMIDKTGAEQASDIEAGRFIVDKTLTDAAAREKKVYDDAYAKADQSGETLAPVDIKPTLDYLNSQPDGLPSTAVPDAAKAYAVKLGIATKDADGKLVARDGVNLREAEAWRKEINKSIGYDPTDQRQGGIIKGSLDGQTEGAGGQLYREARKSRQRYAQLFEDNKVVSDLMGTKPGTADRKVALEDVVDRVVHQGSIDDVRNFRRTLDVSDQHAGFQPGTNGPGRQAWREIQGATLRYIADQAGVTGKNAARDTHGQPIVSFPGLNKALRTLDQDGKLDFILGKKDAQTVRDVAEVASVIKTVPPGAVNSSNTAATLLFALAESGAMAATTGLPAPFFTIAKFLKDRRDTNTLRLKVDQALQGLPQPASPPMLAPSPGTF